jgi:hypothetical protein
VGFPHAIPHSPGSAPDRGARPTLNADESIDAPLERSINRKRRPDHRNGSCGWRASDSGNVTVITKCRHPLAAISRDERKQTELSENGQRLVHCKTHFCVGRHIDWNRTHLPLVHAQ